MTAYTYFKSIIDRLISLALLTLLWPGLVFLFLCVWLDDYKSPLFVQKRIGLGGKLFDLYKIRSMTTRQTLSNASYYCFEGDSRITRLGVYLRKYSLDELPQLINILKGDMAIIGPRPAVHDEFLYEKVTPTMTTQIERRVSVKPGLTGLAQVVYRNDVTWKKKLELDCSYCNLSGFRLVVTDLYILLSTAKLILFPRGTYDTQS